jgi:hypothetical protein
MARDPTSATPITQSTGALQYVFQIDLTDFVKMNNWTTAVNPCQKGNQKTAGKGKAGKPDST